ncbi:MAG: 50S ribosomal protein L10 [Acidimicrobiales bacterium]
MENPRPEKVAAVQEVRERLSEASAVVLTEYRGLDVPSMATLRKSLAEAGATYKVYKNTLVRLAARELGLDIEEMLTGPTALAFAMPAEEGGRGDAVGMAKALREFADGNDLLIIKGGLLDDKFLSTEEIIALSKLASRDELLARLAGGLAAPMQQFAALLAAVPSKFAYALQALIDAGGAPGAPVDVPVAEGGDDSASGSDDTAEGGDDSASGSDDTATTGSDEPEENDQTEEDQE